MHELGKVGVLIIPPGLGKTVLSLLMIKYMRCSSFIDSDSKPLIVVPDHLKTQFDNEYFLLEGAFN